MEFNPYQLKLIRLQKNISVQELGESLGISVAQVHRLEKGERRLTVDMLIKFCAALQLEPAELFFEPSKVPVTGHIDENYEVTAPLPSDSDTVWVDAFFSDVENLAAMRWKPSGDITMMNGHLAFYYRHNEGILENCWGNRSLVVRDDNTQCVGWPLKDGDATHIENTRKRTEFNVDIVWASPIIGVMAPFMFGSNRPALKNGPQF